MCLHACVPACLHAQVQSGINVPQGSPLEVAMSSACGRYLWIERDVPKVCTHVCTYTYVSPYVCKHVITYV